MASSFVSSESCELAVGWGRGGVTIAPPESGFLRATVLAPGRAVAETMVADAQDRAEAAVSESEEARGLQSRLGIISEETQGVSMAELRAMPNTCCDIALPWVMVTD